MGLLNGVILRYLLRQDKPVGEEDISKFVNDSVNQCLDALVGYGNAKKTKKGWVGISSKCLDPYPKEKLIVNAVLKGRKPAAEVSIRCMDLIKKSGIYYKIRPNKKFVIIGKEQKIVDEIIEKFQEINDLHSKIGLLLGFPKTAVEAFEGKIKTRDDEDYVPEKYLGFFTFSKDNYKEEIKVIDGWIEK